MTVKIRLARKGAKKRPFYHVVVADERAPRDGKTITKKPIGRYNPLLAKDDPNRAIFDKEAILYWIGVGAKPTDTVARLLKNAGILN